MDVSSMVVVKPLIATGTGPQLFRASAVADWAKSRVEISIYSVTAQGKKQADHAHCTVQLGNHDEWRRDWKRNAYLIKSRIQGLHNGVDGGQSHKLKRGMVYKLFGALVDYGNSYQGMQEVVLDSSQLEATAQVAFQTTDKDGNFYFSPYCIDSLGHLAGFVMNANDGIDSKSQVFVNHGWESMRCVSRISHKNFYQTYVKMQIVEGTTYAGDTYIFDEDNIVAIFQGVKVSRIYSFPGMYGH